MTKGAPTLQLDSQIVQKFLREMVHGQFKYDDRLPPETELAERFGVSRTAVRDGLAILEREGFINRRQGLGTLINRHVLNIRTRIDLEKEFLDIISDAGYVPAIKYCNVEYGIATEREAQDLQLALKTPVVRVTRLVTADNIPVIHCIDTFPKALIRHHPYDERELHKPIFYFLEKYCDAYVYMNVTEIHAVNATQKLARELGVPKGAAVLHLYENGYDFYGKPVLNSREHYREGMITHTILRKKIH